MDATVYFDLSNKDAYENLTGGSRFEFPPVEYGEDLTIRGRFATRYNGSQVEISRTVRKIQASIGHVDARPESGEFSIKVGPLADESVEGTNVTPLLSFKSSATQIQSALNALSIVGDGGTYGEAKVVSNHDSWLVVFDGEDEAVEIHTGENSLFPLSFLRVRAHEFNGQWQHDLRLIQAPVASTDQSARVVPLGPQITEIQPGQIAGDSKMPAIQKLTLPPQFRGTYQIRRGFVLSPVLKGGSGADADGADEIQEALSGLADPNSGWSVTNPEEGVAHLTATGDWVGEIIDLLEVDIFDAPEGDLTFTLNLATPELAALLRAKEKVTLPISIDAILEDEHDSDKTYKRKLYRGEIQISRELHWEELATAASVDWLRPPLPKDYKPFSRNQVSNGQIHHREAVGTVGALQTEFQIDHNLDTDHVTVIIHANQAAGAPLSYANPVDFAAGEGDYTWERENSNTLTITFRDAPEDAEYVVTVLGLAQTSFFDDHDHEIEEVIGLRQLLDDLGARLSELEEKTGNKKLPSSVSNDTGETARFVLPDIFEVYPSRAVIENPEASIMQINKETLDRPRGLLPAVHDDTVEDMPSRVAVPTSSDKGKVLVNNTGADVIVPVGLGHRTATVKPGGHIASDGRLWFPVKRYGSQEGTEFTTDFATDDTALAIPGHVYPDGTRGRFTTTDTLPAPLAPDTDYFVRDANFEDGTISVATTNGGDAITLTDDGAGTHTFTKRVETSFYPSQFERELFTVAINENQLRNGKTLKVNFALELALALANTAANWTLVMEIGEPEQEVDPALTGYNLKQIKWREIPILEQAILLTPVTAVHRFGFQIDRYTDDGEERFKMTAIRYGGSTGGIAPPASANFALRARLTRFDTEDNQVDPRGFAILKGLKFDESIDTEGLLTVA